MEPDKPLARLQEAVHGSILIRKLKSKKLKQNKKLNRRRRRRLVAILCESGVLV